MRTYGVLIAMLAIVATASVSARPERVAGQGIHDVHLATVHQPPYDQTEIFAVDQVGAVRAMWKVAAGPWFGSVAISGAIASPGAPLAAVFLPSSREVVVLGAGNDGAVWEIRKANNGAWQPPKNIARPNTASATGGIAAVTYGNGRFIEVLFIGRNGALWAASKDGAAGWYTRTITGPNAAREGAPVAAVYNPGFHEVYAFFIGRGSVSVVNKPGDGAWQDAEPLPHPPGLGENWVANSGPVTATANKVGIGVDPFVRQVEVFVVGSDGALWDVYKDGLNQWRTPVRMTDPDFASTRAPLAVGVPPAEERLHVYVVDKNGTLQVIADRDQFGWLTTALSGPRFLKDGTPLVAVESPAQLKNEVLYVDDNFTLGGAAKLVHRAWDRPVHWTAAGLGQSYSTRDCVKWYQRFRANTTDPFVDDRAQEYCLWIMGVWQHCRSHNSYPVIAFDAAGRRSHFICQENWRESTFIEEIEQLATGIAAMVETAVVAAAPYFGLIVAGVSCTTGALFACAFLLLDGANLLGAGIPAEAREALVIVEQVAKCAKLDVTACAQAGMAGAKALGLSIPGVDIAKVVEDGRQCGAKNFASCMRLTLAATDAVGVPIGVGQGDIANIEHCLKEDKVACFALGRLAAKAANFPLADVVQGVENARRCFGNETAACITLGRSLVGAALPKGIEHAQGCVAGNTTACLELGKALVGGRLARDIEQAQRCGNGDENACITLGKTLIGGALPKGTENIARCLGGDTNACIDLGRGLAGAGVALNAARAQQCSGGDMLACIDLGRELARAAGADAPPNVPPLPEPVIPQEGRPGPAQPAGGAPPPLPVVRTGASGESVRTIQYLLRHHGVPVDVDGGFGPQTEAGVRAFQQRRNLPVDGAVGPQTWTALFVTVQQGSTGELVRALQSQLASRGIEIAVDGDFGPVTAAAVRAYQGRAGLAADGVVGPQTWAALVGGR